LQGGAASAPLPLLLTQGYYLIKVGLLQQQQQQQQQ
jgi:hypothetical protein